MMADVNRDKEKEKAAPAKLGIAAEMEDEDDNKAKRQDVTMSAMVAQTVLNNFQGLEGIDSTVRTAVLDFSYNLSIGNLDEAFKAIKLVKSESVWASMARLCVKTRRLDVATVCLGNMKNARASRALRKAASYASNDLDARVAILALYLGMHEDAVRLLKSANRYDLLTKYYQGMGNWQEALKNVETHDQVHMNSTYRNYGKYLESENNIKEAAVMYTKAKTDETDVPKMLMENPVELESYATKSKKA